MKSVVAILAEIRPESNFVVSTDFIADGLLDSFDVMTLVATLDEHFGVSIDGVDIVPENFRDVQAIEALLTKCGAKL